MGKHRSGCSFKTRNTVVREFLAELLGNMKVKLHKCSIIYFHLITMKICVDNFWDCLSCPVSSLSSGQGWLPLHQLGVTVQFLRLHRLCSFNPGGV